MPSAPSSSDGLELVDDEDRGGPARARPLVRARTTRILPGLFTSAAFHSGTQLERLRLAVRSSAVLPWKMRSTAFSAAWTCSWYRAAASFERSSPASSFSKRSGRAASKVLMSPTSHCCDDTVGPQDQQRGRGIHPQRGERLLLRVAHQGHRHLQAASTSSIALSSTSFGSRLTANIASFVSAFHFW